MTRHELREQTFLMLFGVGFHTADKDAVLRRYLEDTCEFFVTEEEQDEIVERVLAIDRCAEELNRDIDSVAKSWKTARMGRAELCILRLALYELKYDAVVPVKVSINEAVELAKVYGDAEAPAFVNGVLARLVEKACEKTDVIRKETGAEDQLPADETSLSESGTAGEDASPTEMQML